MKIGFFDSGKGGMMILDAVRELLPEYDYIYYGDTANLPYGDKTEAEVYDYTKQGIQALFEENCALVVIACNTACSETLRKLQDDWLPEAYPDKKILGVIIPMIEEVLEATPKRALLIATRRTVKSGKYHFELGKHQVLSTKIESIATRGLVPLIEAGKNDEAVEMAISAITAEQNEGTVVDGIILGCTHYVVLKNPLRKHYGEAVTVFSPDEIIPKKLADYLERHAEIRAKLTTDCSKDTIFTQ